MNVRITLALLAIAVGLGAFIWILDRRSPTGEQRKGYILEFDRNDVTSIEITNEAAKTILHKTASGWQIVAPVNDRADARVLDSLLDQLRFLRQDDLISDLGKKAEKQKRLKDFGLLKPRLKIEWQAKNRKFGVEFGADAAVEGTCYIRTQGNDEVFVTGNEVKDLVSKRSDAFRDHQITPFLTTQIDRVILHQNVGDIELVRQQDDWQIVRPIKARAGNGTVNAMLEKINTTPILGFVESEKAPKGENENPSRSVSLYSGDEKVEISCGSPIAGRPGKIYLRIASRPSLVEVSDAFGQTIDVKPNQLRDRKIARLNPDFVDHIRIDHSGGISVFLVRQEDHWQIASDQNAPANSEMINQLITMLNGTDVREFVSDTATDLGRHGLDPPALRIAFSSYASDNTAESSAGEEPVATLAVGKLDNNAYYARIEEEPYVFSIDQQTVDSLPTHNFSFRSLDVLRLQRSDLLSLNIEDSDGLTEITREDGQRWLVRTKTGSQDEAALQTLLNTVAQIRAVAWVGPVQPSYGLDHPLETIQIQTKNAQISLQIGSPDDKGNRYATISNRTGVFLLGANDYRQLSAQLVK
jgi:Domain of unknown function (DUF4340)